MNPRERFEKIAKHLNKIERDRSLMGVYANNDGEAYGVYAYDWSSNAPGDNDEDYRVGVRFNHTTTTWEVFGGER